LPLGLACGFLLGFIAEILSDSALWFLQVVLKHELKYTQHNYEAILAGLVLAVCFHFIRQAQDEVIAKVEKVEKSLESKIEDFVPG